MIPASSKSRSVMNQSWHTVFFVCSLAVWTRCLWTLSAVIPTNMFWICNVILDVSDTVGAPALSGEVQTDVSQRKMDHCDIVKFCSQYTDFCIWFCVVSLTVLFLTIVFVSPVDAHPLQYSGTNTEEWWNLDARPCEHSLRSGVEQLMNSAAHWYFSFSLPTSLQPVCAFTSFPSAGKLSGIVMTRARWGVNSKSAWALQHERLS